MIKKRFLSMLVLLAAVVTGAVAQTTYKVSVKEGTDDATSWQGKAGTGEYQALPLEGVAAGKAVTVKYDGRKRVKSVKAVKKDGALAVPLTLEALTAGTIVVNDPQSGMQYSLNGGAKAPVTSEAISVTAGNKVQFYGDGTNISCYNGTTIAGGTADVKVYGNIMSLIDETGYATCTTLQDQVFMGLFSGNTKLTDASGLLLPATTLALWCYAGMFVNCTSLTTAPALPAMMLAGADYFNMFAGCTSLTTAPALPAATLAIWSYAGMFAGCTSLTTAPTLPATTLPEACYESMFSGCTSLTTAPALPAETLAGSCYYEMFLGCTSLTTAPTLPATTLAETCYSTMFKDCTSLVTAPALPAATLARGCYQSMFNGCTSLVTAPTLPAETLASDCYRGMFSGCTSLTTAPVLPATTLAESCYGYMFNGCTSLSSITCLATEGINENNSTSNWLKGVASTGTFTKASGANWPTGVNGIPSGWTVNEQ